MESCGLYVHVPFCLRKCNYCDFVSYPYEKELAGQYLLLLFQEMELLASQYNYPPLETIYLGGGTPTCLGGQELGEILRGIREHFPVESDAEITSEMNPATARFDELRAMRTAGFNRLSIGVQAFQPELLSYLGRVHSLAAVGETVQMAREVGFYNLNLDLIYAIPGQRMEDWRESLEAALALEPEHLSLYSLKIEEGTPFFREYDAGRLEPVDDETDYRMYLEAIQILAEAGYRHYEISNFARPGYESRHNLRYWHFEPYLALGPAAHGFDGHRRYENLAALHDYQAALMNAQLPWAEVLPLTKEDLEEEFMFMGLRLMEGVSLEEFARRFGQPLGAVYGAQIEKLQRLGLLECTGERLRLTGAGIPLGNQVFLEFLFDR